MRAQQQMLLQARPVRAVITSLLKYLKQILLESLKNSNGNILAISD